MAKQFPVFLTINLCTEDDNVLFRLEYQAEKISSDIHFDDKENQEQLARLHLDFKRANGYSELEIANKRQSLENILVTESKQAHLERLKVCGFKESSCYFQCLNFASFLSVK